MKKVFGNTTFLAAGVVVVLLGATVVSVASARSTGQDATTIPAAADTDTPRTYRAADGGALLDHCGDEITVSADEIFELWDELFPAPAVDHQNDDALLAAAQHASNAVAASLSADERASLRSNGTVDGLDERYYELLEAEYAKRGLDTSDIRAASEVVVASQDEVDRQTNAVGDALQARRNMSSAAC